MKSVLPAVLFLFIQINGVNAVEAGKSNPVIVAEIQTEIDGSTRRNALLKEINLSEGMEFESLEALNLYMDETVQSLINMRVFDEVNYALEEIDNREYKLILRVKDSITFYPVPYPKYSSNYKWRLGLKFYFYNAFGTMTDWFLFSNMDISDLYDGEWSVKGWHITPIVEGLYFLNKDFRAEYSHKYLVKPYENESGSEKLVNFFHNDSISLGTKFYLPMDFYYSMDPRLEVSYNLENYLRNADGSMTLLSEDPAENEYVDTLQFSWNHIIGYDTIDWIGTFRNGFSASLANSIYLSSDFAPDESVNLSTDFIFEAKYFWRINNRFNLSTIGTGLLSFNRTMTELGSYMRGIVDEELSGDKAFFWSIDMNINVIDWDGVGEAHFQPFFNLGFVGKGSEGEVVYTTGADFILFLDKLKAIQARGTLAVNLGEYEWSDGEKYEIDIDMSLSY